MRFDGRADGLLVRRTRVVATLDSLESKVAIMNDRGLGVGGVGVVCDVVVANCNWMNGRLWPDLLENAHGEGTDHPMVTQEQIDRKRRERRRDEMDDEPILSHSTLVPTLHQHARGQPLRSHKATKQPSPSFPRMSKCAWPSSRHLGRGRIKVVLADHLPMLAPCWWREESTPLAE